VGLVALSAKPTIVVNNYKNYNYQGLFMNLIAVTVSIGNGFTSQKAP
jgi:hypothetical protein